MRRLLPLLIPLFLVLGACQSSPAHKLSEQERLTQESEKLHLELKRRGLVFGDPEAEQYLQSLADRLLSAAGEVPRCRFFITKNPVANAMALPNGDVYITIGLLVALHSDDQLAAVMAHEIGHVVAQHSLKTLHEREGTKLTANIADIFLLGTGLAFLPAMSSLASFSRDQEKEADLSGLQTLTRAGFDADSSPNVFEVFRQLPESMGTKDSVYSSHPNNVDRIQYLRDVIDTKLGDQRRTPTQSLEFRQMQSRVLEEVVKIRLRQRQYRSALMTLDQFTVPDEMIDLVNYYRAEVYRLMAQHPDHAGQEDRWLTEDDRSKTKPSEYFVEHAVEHYGQARTLLDGLLNRENPFTLAYRGAGMIAFEHGQCDLARDSFQRYLERGEPNDRLYIENLIGKCERKTLE
jgi:predicted Zn-dependent protease